MKIYAVAPAWIASLKNIKKNLADPKLLKVDGVYKTCMCV